MRRNRRLGNTDTIDAGIVGAAGRGGAFRSALEANGARIADVCDIREDLLARRKEEFGADGMYTDYDDMLERADIDAVVIGTPMECHASQAIAALERGIHVLCEVPAAVSVEECEALARAAQASDAVYMMAENYVYQKANALVGELIRRGEFGDVYYAEAEYLHNVKNLAERTTWRRHWQLGIPGITYGTHSLGPVLQWMAGDRVARVCCETSGSHYADPRGEPYGQDTAVMLCKTEGGALVKIRMDLVSDRPHAMTNYQIQGTDGAYESGRGGPGDRPKIWLRSLSEKQRWLDVEALLATDEFAGKLLPDRWRNPPDAALKAGHGGGDYFEICDFLDAVRGKSPAPIGIHEALDMTLPGLVSQRSASQGGNWLPVPNSRQWSEKPRRSQLQMIWPEDRLSDPPAVAVPDGYVLRQYRPEDEKAYLGLMVAAGFEKFTPELLAKVSRRILPDGFFLIEHCASGRIVATAMATHNPHKEHPFGAELSFVAADADHSGKGLGMAVSAVVTRRLLDSGYRRIYLLTDDFRLPAVKIYLKLGYVPFMLSDDMPERWKALYSQLSWPAPSEA